MSSIEMVKSAREDVVQLQSALNAVEAGLESVEVAAEAVDVARRGFRRALQGLLVIGVIGLVVVGVRAALRSRGDDGLEPAPSDSSA